MPQYIRSLAFYLFLALLVLPLAAQQRHALLVGISQYPEAPADCRWDPIHGANDVALMQQTLLRQDFSPALVTTLTDAQATASAIRAAFTMLTQHCAAGDVVYIHFSCHGQLCEDLDADERDGWDEALVPYDARRCYEPGVYEGENHILDDELHARLSELRLRLGPTGMVYVALDACHIGEAYMGDGYVRGTNLVFSPNGRRYVRSDVKRRNRGSLHAIEATPGYAPVCMIEACHAYELNMERRVGDTYYGALTYHIAQVLTHTQLDASTHWWMTVKQHMDDDPALIYQTAVIETTLP